MSSPQDTYDVSATERKTALARAARRETLRREYLKQIGNPYRMATGEGGTVFDEGMQRFHSMKAKRVEYFRPTPRSGIFTFCSVVIPIALTMWVVFGSRDRLEHRYRTGQISYRDREFKFT